PRGQSQAYIHRLPGRGQLLQSCRDLVFGLVLTDPSNEGKRANISQTHRIESHDECIVGYVSQQHSAQITHLFALARSGRSVELNKEQPGNGWLDCLE